LGIEHKGTALVCREKRIEKREKIAALELWRSVKTYKRESV